jgi:hypothetical protein
MTVHATTSGDSNGGIHNPLVTPPSCMHGQSLSVTSNNESAVVVHCGILQIITWQPFTENLQLASNLSSTIPFR